MLKPNDLGLRAAVVFCPLLRRRGGQATGRKAVREPRGLRADLRVLTGEREPAHRLDRRGRGGEHPARSQGDAKHGLSRWATADRFAHQVRAGVGAF